MPQHWVDVQREQLKRLGIGGDWDNPYLTMNFEAEATIVAELFKFAESGQLYRGAKPVMWSPVEKTALAEAEIEYEDIVSTQIDVAFEIVESPIPELVGAHAVIWTTTPWTIPVNQAIAYGPEVEYVACRSTTRRRVPGRRRPGRCETFAAAVRSTKPDRGRRRSWREHRSRDDLSKAPTSPAPSPATRCTTSAASSPSRGRSCPATSSPPTAAPASSTWRPTMARTISSCARRNGIDPVFAVEARRQLPRGLAVARRPGQRHQPQVQRARRADLLGPARGRRAARRERRLPAQLSASAGGRRPRSSTAARRNGSSPWTGRWRDSSPRASREQRWDNEGGADPDEGDGATLRQLALQRHRATPASSPKRAATASARWSRAAPTGCSAASAPGACRSRCSSTARPASFWSTARSTRASSPRSREQGVDAWAADNAAHFLGTDRNPDDYEMVTDILDVWFDSGCTHVFTLESGHWPEQRWPADLYLEGSDQHRGWFQSSLLESCGTRGRAPYDAVLTHGFTMDAKGMKMSKSLGNTINPLKVMRDYGADILRLWALSVDFTEDHRIGKEILAGRRRPVSQAAQHLPLSARRARRVQRRRAGRASPTMPELERYMLAPDSRELDAKLRTGGRRLRLQHLRPRADRLLQRGSVAPSSSISARTPLLRRAGPIRSAAPIAPCSTPCSTRWSAGSRRCWCSPPRKCGARAIPTPGRSICSNGRKCPPVDADDAKWAELRALRTQVTEAIEPLRRDKVVGSSLEAEVTVPDAADVRADLAELFIASTVQQGDGLQVAKTEQSQMRPLLAAAARGRGGRRRCAPAARRWSNG